MQLNTLSFKFIYSGNGLLGTGGKDKVQRNSGGNFVWRISGFHMSLGYKEVLDVY